MTSAVVLIVAGGLIVLVLYWSGRYGGRGRQAGTSLRRGPRAHTTSRGRPKKGYPTREQALAQAEVLATRDGSRMGAYRCDTCGKWHIGHEAH